MGQTSFLITHLPNKVHLFAIVNFGDFSWMWYADMALALFAALVNLPIREAPVARQAAPA